MHFPTLYILAHHLSAPEPTSLPKKYIPETLPKIRMLTKQTVTARDLQQVQVHVFSSAPLTCQTSARQVLEDTEDNDQYLDSALGNTV